MSASLREHVPGALTGVGGERAADGPCCQRWTAARH